MNILCCLFGHKKLELDIFKKEPLILIGVKDILGCDLLNVYLCERCKLLYWE